MRVWAVLGASVSALACNAVLGLGSYRPCAGDECDGGDASAETGEAGEAGGPQPITLATGLTKPDAITLDDANVYFATFEQAGTIYDCPLAGCDANGPHKLTGNQIGVNDLFVSSGELYWVLFATGGAIRGCSVASCVPQPFASAQVSPTTLTFANGAIYWADATNVYTCTASVCNSTITTLATSGGKKAGVVVDANTIYWTNYDNGRVETCPIQGGTVAVFAAAQGAPGHIALDPNNVYWTASTDGTIVTCPKTGCGASPTVLAGGLSLPWGIALDDANVYWTNEGDGTVMKCDKSACGSPATIATGQSSPYAIAVGTTSVYWTNDGNGASGAGSVMMLTPK